jgi:hypothetical protein
VDAAEPQTMRCYRHPDRETLIRCGRCDQPICTKCAMQGPVGFRCKQCGKPQRDALASLRPTQLAAAIGLAVGGGAIIAYIGVALGWFMILVAFFGGGFVVEAIDRVVGIKRGPRMVAIVFGGILLGSVLGGVLGLAQEWLQFAQVADGELPMTLETLLLVSGPTVLIAAGAALVGAYSRLR